MIETKTREPQFALPDDLPEDHLPEPAALTHEQIAAQKEADERDRQRRLEILNRVALTAVHFPTVLV